MNKTLRDIGGLSIISGVGLLVGMVTQMVLARRFGIGSDLDVFFAAQTVPAFLYGQLAFCLGTSFLPVLARTTEKKGERFAWEYASNFLNSVALLGLLLGVALAVNARFFVGWFVPRLSPEQVPMAVIVFQIAVLASFHHCLFQLVSYLHHHQDRFLLVAAAGLLVNVCAMLGAVFFSGFGIYGVAVGRLVGYVLELGVAIRGFARYYRPRLSWRCEDSRRTYQRASPMLATVAVGKADPVIERAVAASLDVGAISSLGFSGKIVSSLATLTTQGISTVLFPRLARLAAAEQGDRVGRSLAEYVGQTFLLVMPLAAFLAFFRHDAVRILYERGRFTPGMTGQVAMVVLCYCGVYVFSGVGSLLSRGFHIAGKTQIPATISVLGTGLYLVLAIVLARVMGVAGIALAFSLQFLFGFGAQLVMLRRLYPSFRPLLVLGKALEYGGWAFLSGLAVRRVLDHLAGPPVGVLGLLLTLAFGTAAIAILYFGGLLAVREPGAVGLARAASRRIRDRRAPRTTREVTSLDEIERPPVMHLREPEPSRDREGAGPGDARNPRPGPAPSPSRLGSDAFPDRPLSPAPDEQTVPAAVVGYAVGLLAAGQADGVPTVGRTESVPASAPNSSCGDPGIEPECARAMGQAVSLPAIAAHSSLAERAVGPGHVDRDRNGRDSRLRVCPTAVNGNRVPAERVAAVGRTGCPTNRTAALGTVRGTGDGRQSTGEPVGRIRALFVTAGGRERASTRCRVLQYLPRLAEAWDVAHSPLGTSPWGERRAALGNQAAHTPWQRGVRRLRYDLYGAAARRADDAAVNALAAAAVGRDLLFLQKVVPPAHVMRRLAAHAGAVVFDFDDALFTLEEESPTRAERVFLQRLEVCLSACDLVITGCAFNAEYASRFARRVEVVPTPVDVERYAPGPARAKEEEVTIGWIGSPSTTPHLRDVLPVLQSVAAARPRVRFLFVGAEPFPTGDLPAAFEAWAYATELAHLARFDIGIMPLRPTPHALGKAGYKLLQYMALGRPSVASPVGVNAEIVLDGVTGFVATGAEQWRDRLIALIDDADLRARLGAAGRRRAVEHYSVDAVFPRWRALLEEVCYAAAR